MSAPRGIAPAEAEPLVSIATVDYAGLMRARSLTRKSFDTSGPVKSCGWVPANMSLTPFDEIADPNPWGSTGDLRLLADLDARFRAWPARAASPLDIVMADIVELDGTPWTACPRAFLKGALADFKAETGCDFLAAFEQEYQILDAGWDAAPAFSLSAQRRADPFGPELMAALEQAGLEPEVFIAEYGKDQYEIASAPAPGLVAADRAAVVREIVRETARLHGWRASFAPKTAVEGVGNGVHVHFSFAGPDGPAAYDASAPGNLSGLAASFCAGILRHLPALTAFTAPSPLSAMRLVPHHWSASYTWLGVQRSRGLLAHLPCHHDRQSRSRPPVQHRISRRRCHRLAASRRSPSSCVPALPASATACRPRPSFPAIPPLCPTTNARPSAFAACRNPCPPRSIVLNWTTRCPAGSPTRRSIPIPA